MRQHGLRESIPLNRKNLPAGVIAIALSGSRLYNIARDDSDYDIVAITKNNRKATQKIVGNEDLNTISITDFINRVMISATPETSLLASGTIEIIDENYRPIIESLRYNYLILYWNYQTYSLQVLEWLLKTDRSERQELKTLRAISRNTIISRKLLELKNDFTPILSNEEKSDYYKLLKLSSSIIRTATREELLELFELPEDSLKW